MEIVTEKVPSKIDNRRLVASVCIFFGQNSVCNNMLIMATIFDNKSHRYQKNFPKQISLWCIESVLCACYVRVIYINTGHDFSPVIYIL